MAPEELNFFLAVKVANINISSAVISHFRPTTSRSSARAFVKLNWSKSIIYELQVCTIVLSSKKIWIWELDVPSSFHLQLGQLVGFISEDAVKFEKVIFVYDKTFAAGAAENWGWRIRRDVSKVAPWKRTPENHAYCRHPVTNATALRDSQDERYVRLRLIIK